jgi:hypothetical protein
VLFFFGGGVLATWEAMLFNALSSQCLFVFLHAFWVCFSFVFSAFRVCERRKMDVCDKEKERKKETIIGQAC